MVKSTEIYDLMLDNVASHDAIIDELIIGLTWTYCRSEYTGLCMTANTRSRTFEWSGSLKGKPVSSLAEWVRGWDAMKSSIGMSAINSVINKNSNSSYKLIPHTHVGRENLAVFDYFLPHIKDKKSVVIGRYPGMEILQQEHDLKIIELDPGVHDYPAPASEFLLPDAEWVFLTGTSLANKTFPRLMELSQNANVVLMGPSVPWLDELSLFGVDFLVGVNVMNDTRLKQNVSEGAGVNIFSDSVQYMVHDLSEKKLIETRSKISHTVNQRERLKDEMEIWYRDLHKGTFPRAFELVALDEELSLLDSQFKQMWDLRQNLTE